MKIQFKRGLESNLPALDEGEPAFTTDTKKLIIGDTVINPDGTTSVEWNDVTGKPETYQPAIHNHDDAYEPVISTKNSAFNVNFGTTNGTACQGDDERLSNARAPTTHTHDDRYFTETEIAAAISSAINALINGSPGALDTLNELAIAMGNDANFSATMTNALANKVDKVTGKQLSTEDFTTILLQKLNGIAAGANVYIHPTTHSISEVSGLQDALSLKANTGDLPVNLSDLTNDIGAGGGIVITVSSTEPTSTVSGEFWLEEI